MGLIFGVNIMCIDNNIMILILCLIIILLIVIYHILKGFKKRYELYYNDLSPEDIFNLYLKSIPKAGGNKVIRWQVPDKPHKLALAIVEPRNHHNLEWVLNNVAVLYALRGGKELPSLHIFHGISNETLVRNITRGWEGVNLINLGVENLRIADYNMLLTSSDFYRNFEKAGHVLIFQTDVIQFKRVPEEFFEYDYVGAPWSAPPTPTNLVGNGGFSLRRVSKMIEICNRERLSDPNYPEDVFFSLMKDIHIPSVKKAAKFSVEQIYDDNPVGAHQIYLTLSRDDLIKLLNNNIGLLTSI